MTKKQKKLLTIITEVGPSHLTLQSVCLLGCLQLHVIRQRGVLMQGQPVVLIAHQRLGLFSMGHLQHVHGKVKL